MTRTSVADKVRENRIRRALERQGYRLSKSRRRDPRAKDFDRYVILHERTGELVDDGMETKPLTISEVEAWTDAEDDERRQLAREEHFGIALAHALHRSLVEGTSVDLSHVLFTLRDEGGDDDAMTAMAGAWESFYDWVEQARKEIHDGLDAAGVFEVAFKGIEELDLNDPIAVKKANEESEAAAYLLRRDPERLRRLVDKFRDDPKALREAVLQYAEQQKLEPVKPDGAMPQAAAEPRNVVRFPEQPTEHLHGLGPARPVVLKATPRIDPSRARGQSSKKPSAPGSTAATSAVPESSGGGTTPSSQRSKVVVGTLFRNARTMALRSTA